ncbi:MAG: bacteriophage abortive infection AbiH family protein [Clostridiales bacterium]|nr:bacteriophage abortive infection AbiH family protein [Clostridiales bacterium]
MNTQLVILGNGFDRHCGLKSDYESFFKSEILDCEAENSNILKMQDNCTGFWETLLFKYYKQNPHHNKNWCNVEALIQDTLELLYFGKSKWLGETVYSIRDIALQRAKSKQFFQESNDFASLLIDYSSKFFSKCLQENSSCNEKELFAQLSEDLVTELHNFEKKFCKYIKYQIETNHFEYEIKAVNLLCKIIGIEQVFSHINQILKTLVGYNNFEFNTDYDGKRILTKNFPNLRPVHILSFNYTSLFDILGVSSPCKYTNVHGKLCSENCSENCKLSNIIFGIDDMSIKAHSNENDLRLFSKTYRKMVTTSSPTKILPPNNNITEIKFYGHSLSEADYSYFQSIFDYYNIYNNYNVSLFFYYSKGYEQPDAIYRMINEYGKTIPNQAQGKNLIHKLLLENRLRIQEVKE